MSNWSRDRSCPKSHHSIYSTKIVAAFSDAVAKFKASEFVYSVDQSIVRRSFRELDKIMYNDHRHTHKPIFMRKVDFC